jgi:hypothetical protein
LGFLKQPLAEGHLQFQEEGVDEMVTLPVLMLEQTARSRALVMLQEISLVDRELIDERGRILAAYPPPESVGELSAKELEGAVVKAVHVR